MIVQQGQQHSLPADVAVHLGLLRSLAVLAPQVIDVLSEVHENLFAQLADIVEVSENRQIHT